MDELTEDQANELRLAFRFLSVIIVAVLVLTVAAVTGQAFA